MDDYFKKRMRVVSVVAVIVATVFMVIFSFIQYREKKDAVVKLKMFYSDMSQSIQYSVNNNGLPGDWGWQVNSNNADILSANLINNLRISKNCMSQKGDCMPATEYKNINNKITKVKLSALPAIEMQNGISFAAESMGSCSSLDKICAIFYVDINGKEPPNVFGKDLFLFLLVNSNSVPFIPYNSRLSADTLTDDFKYGCNKNSEMALYCSAVIYRNGWNIDKTYPW